MNGNPITIPEALSLFATHTCPRFGGRFHPRQCALRIERAKHFHYTRDVANDFQACAGCSGPVPIQDGAQAAQIMPPRSAKPVWKAPPGHRKVGEGKKHQRGDRDGRTGKTNRNG